MERNIKVSPIETSAEMRLRTDAERLYIFNNTWHQVDDKFTCDLGSFVYVGIDEVQSARRNVLEVRLARKRLAMCPDS